MWKISICDHWRAKYKGLVKKWENANNQDLGSADLSLIITYPMQVSCILPHTTSGTKSVVNGLSWGQNLYPILFLLDFGMEYLDFGPSFTLTRALGSHSILLHPLATVLVSLFTPLLFIFLLPFSGKLHEDIFLRSLCNWCMLSPLFYHRSSFVCSVNWSKINCKCLIA